MIMFPNILLNGSSNYKSSNGVSAANTSAANSSPSGSSNNNNNNSNTFSTPAVPSLLLPPPIPPMPTSSANFYSSSPANLALLRQHQQSKKPVSLTHFSPASQPCTSNNPGTVDSASQFFYKNLMANNPSILNTAPTAITSLHGLDQPSQPSLLVNSYFNNYLLAVLSQATASNIANTTIMKVCCAFSCLFIFLHF